MTERHHNLRTKQPNIEPYIKPNDGFETDIVDQSDQIRVGVKDGKTSSSEKSEVSSFSKSLGEKNGNKVDVQ